MKQTLFHLISDYTFQTVALGSALLGIISGALGSFAVLRRQSLLGDGVSHAALPGVGLAFLLTGSKNTEVLLLGALLSGLAAALLIMKIIKHSRIRFDAALALVMSVFFGLGLVLLSYIQRLPNANQAGLNRFIYGQASTLLRRDVIIMAVCAAIMLSLLALFWKELKIFCFDVQFAASLGFSYAKLNLLLSGLIVLAIIIGLQTVGVVLMSAMLIAPAAAARQWSNRLGIMVFLAAVFGAMSGLCGTAISSGVSGLPTGPVIVLCASAFVLFSLLFAPARGLVSIYFRSRLERRRLAAEGEARV